MRVRVRLFAMLRERAGRDSLELELADDATAADALEAARREAGLDGELSRLPVAIAVNREYVRGDVALADGDEVALIPPVSGGGEGAARAVAAGERVHARVTEEPLSVDRLWRLARRSQAGAVVVFTGTTRDVPRLEYEAYGEMAEERIRAILIETLERRGLEAAVAEHRVGSVPLGEPSVVVAVSAVHRAEAFAGARDAIDRIKAEAPIWKREVDGAGDGAPAPRWVEGTPPPPPG
jgi:MoaE-MoaD fusion protein